MQSGKDEHAARLAMRVAALLVVLSTAPACSSYNGCDATSEPTHLFNGVNLDGWTRRGGAATYIVEDGSIVGRTAPNQPNSFLCTERAFGDFELTLTFRVDPALNSGVQVRSQSMPGYKNGAVHGYQVEIDPGERAWTGGLYDEGRRGWLVDLKDKPEARSAFRHGEWNELRISARGDTFNTWLNGVDVVQNFHDSMTAEGFIALQVHGVGDRKEPLEVRWKNIRVRELP